MKFFIVGLHASGKRNVLELLAKDGVPTGQLFTNVAVNDDIYDLYTTEDIHTIFENKAYIFIKEFENVPQGYEGLTLYEFDNKVAFALSPDQFIAIPVKPLRDEVCIVWLDNTETNRKSRYKAERRIYDWNEVEARERLCEDDFIKTVYNFPNSHNLYFSNEDPNRVATIIYTLYKHPDLLPKYEKTFN